MAIHHSSDHERLRDFLIGVGEAVCDAAQHILRSRPVHERTAIHTQMASDVIYAIDHDAEQVIVAMFAEQAARFGGIVLVAEGIGAEEVTVYPQGMSFEKARWRVIMDPIDGTRGIMYDKRPAFFLAGAAPNKGQGTRLADVEAAVMVEISTTRMHVSDTLHAIRGRGVGAFRRNLLDGGRHAFTPEPTRLPTIRGGFAQFARFFPSGKEELARIEEELVHTLYPDAKDGEILTFEDQYISTGGQLYEVLTGKDRFVADIRHALYSRLRGTLRPGLTCHPYDLAALLVATEAGLIVTDIEGKPLDAPMDTTTETDWIAYANAAIHREVAPVLGAVLRRHGLID